MSVLQSNNSSAGELPISTAGDEAFYNLLPALIQCFVVILLGYLSGRTGLVHSDQGKGLGVFVSKFAMPAMLFKSMCELDFGNVDWRFLAAILITKSTIFAAVLLGTALLARPIDFGKMGVYGIFTTQSHDFALGIPIVQALYKTTHPEFESYLYLIAPISVAFLNPIGFAMMATQNWRRTSPDERKSMTSSIFQIFANVISNPVVFMTILGIIFNFIFHQKIPTFLDDILVVLKNAFPAAALFCLGHGMVGRRSEQKDKAFVVLFLLIAAKMVVCPLLTRELVYALATGSNETEIGDLSGYGFLYGMFPTAPSVFIYASYYNTETDLMATGMVISTFVAAPLMFVSGKMLMMPVSEKENWISLIHKTSFDIGIINIVCLIWVLAVFYVNRRIRAPPHQFTALLGVSQVVMSVGIILLQTIPESSSSTWQQCLQFILFYAGLLSTRCWVAVIAVSLCILRVRSFCALYAWRPYLIFYAIGIPLIVSGVLLASTPQARMENRDTSFLNGNAQRIVMLCALIINMVLAVAALVRSHRYDMSRLVVKKELDETSEDDDQQPLNTPALLINGPGQFLTQGPNNRYTSPMSICHSAPSRFAIYKPKRTIVPSPMLAGIRQRMGREDLEESDEERPNQQLRVRPRPRQDSDDYTKLAVENSMRKRQDTEDLAKLVERWGLEGSRRDSENEFLKADGGISRQVSEDVTGSMPRKDSADVIGRGMRLSRDNSEMDFKKFQQQDGAGDNQKEEQNKQKEEEEDSKWKRRRRERRAAQREVEIEQQKPEVDQGNIEQGDGDNKFFIGNKPLRLPPVANGDAIVPQLENNQLNDKINNDIANDSNDVRILPDIEDINVKRQLRRKRAQSGPAKRTLITDNQPRCEDCGQNEGQTCTDIEAADDEPLLLQSNGSATRMSPECRPDICLISPCENSDGCMITKTFRETSDVSSEDELLILQDQDLIQYSRHLVLILLLLVSAFVSLCLLLWTMMMQKITSVYVEVEFLDSVLSYGQGFFLFAVFGIDQQLIIEPLAKRWRDWFTGHAEIVLPSWGDLSEDTRKICEQFQDYHLVQCAEVIVTDRRETLRLYRDVFLGTHLVDWLLQVGLASDRAAAVQYGRHLLAGRVIEHIAKKHHFQDLPYFYRFIEGNDSNFVCTQDENCERDCNQDDDDDLIDLGGNPVV